jgi:Na+-driven multidrug efflux pump
VRVYYTVGRWVFCFLALPALWIAVSLGTDLQAVLMIPAAIVIALLSALTAYRSGRGKRGTLGHFLGTSLMIGVAFSITIAILFAIYCGDGSTEGVC